MRATCSAHLILLNMIALIIFCEAYKLCSVLQLPATSSLLGPNIHRSPSGSLTYTTFEIPSFEMVWSWYLSRLPCLRSHRKAEGGGGGHSFQGRTLPKRFRVSDHGVSSYTAAKYSSRCKKVWIWWTSHSTCREGIQRRCKWGRVRSYTFH
jgi:hypothetical protein